MAALPGSGWVLGSKPHNRGRTFASPSAVGSLINRYRTEATSIFYPYPSRFTGALPTDHRIDFLLITLPLDFIRRAGDWRNVSSDISEGVALRTLVLYEDLSG